MQAVDIRGAALAVRECRPQILAEGEQLPAVKLKDGTRVQTGTVATMLHNVARYNSGERGRVEVELEMSVPTLIKVGLFELFPVEDWIAGTNPGRRFVGLAARKLMEAQ
ncbi:hypothetical protein WKW79_24080 [Variovorax robiniae]|uniref:DUF7709 domain-containing protein n=1 Tax=Variovorax robiniae TaxID=1836199 RepID=A0ABU8XD51_9BURK